MLSIETFYEGNLFMCQQTDRLRVLLHWWESLDLGNQDIFASTTHNSMTALITLLGPKVWPIIKFGQSFPTSTISKGWERVRENSQFLLKCLDESHWGKRVQKGWHSSIEGVGSEGGTHSRVWGACLLTINYWMAFWSKIRENSRKHRWISIFLYIYILRAEGILSISIKLLFLL